MLTIKRLEIDDAGVVTAGARAKAVAIRVPLRIALTDEAGADAFHNTHA